MGEKDSRELPLCDHIFLLEKSGTVIGSRSTLARPNIGDDFFSVYALTRREAKRVRSAYEAREASAFLLRHDRKTPLLLFGMQNSATFWAVVPAGELSRAMCALPENEDLPSWLLIDGGTKGLAEDAQSTVQDYLRRWQKITMSFSTRVQTAEEVCRALVFDTETASLLCGCKIAYDYTTAAALFLRTAVDTPTLRVFLAAASLTARRLTEDCSVFFFVEHAGNGTAYLNAMFRPTHTVTDAELTELSGLSRALAPRGEALRRSYLQDGRVLVAVAMCRAELSVQGMKGMTRPHLPPAVMFDDRLPGRISPHTLAMKAVPFDAAEEDDALLERSPSPQWQPIPFDDPIPRKKK